jgi:hypothetical protein
MPLMIRAYLEGSQLERRSDEARSADEGERVRIAVRRVGAVSVDDHLHFEFSRLHVLESQHERSACALFPEVRLLRVADDDDVLVCPDAVRRGDVGVGDDWESGDRVARVTVDNRPGADRDRVLRAVRRLVLRADGSARRRQPE